MREVQGADAILKHAKVQSLDSLGACVGAVVARRDQLRASESNLVVEDGIVADEGLDRFGLDVNVKLETISSRMTAWLSYSTDQ